MFATWKRLGRHGLLSSVLGLAGVVGAYSSAPSEAQEAPAKIRVKSKVFQLPLQIEDSYRPRIREVRLFMKEGQGDWALKETVPPTVRSFRCQLPHDGEFSFSVVIVDHNGLAYPADLNSAPPAMTVVLETQSRAITMEIPRPQTAEIPFPETPNVVNKTTVIEKAPNPGPTVVIPATTAATPVPATSPPIATGPAMTTITALNPTTTPAAPGAVEIIEMSKSHSSPLPLPFTSSAAKKDVTSPTNPALHANGPEMGKAPAPKATARILESTPTQPPVTGATSTPANKNHPLVNNVRVGIDYNISKVGPSGIGKVDVWFTTDEGKSWQRLGEDPDRTSPAQVELPGEGVFGFRLVAVNGNGFGGKNPVPGDAPTSVVEVDLTAPTVQVLDVDPADKSGALNIRWRVTDKNLPADSVTLSYSGDPNGPWRPLADKQKNEGQHLWTLPRDIAPQLFFRLEIADLAGNVTRHDTKTPVVLDTVQPDVNVLGITVVPPAAVKGIPSGN